MLKKKSISYIKKINVFINVDMKQEDKEVLIKDLSARLPYGVKVSLHDEENGDLTGVLYAVYPTEERVIVDDLSKAIAHQNVRCGGFKFEENNVKPYLRPMSSMTEEEGKELEQIFCEIDAPCWVDTEYGCVNFSGGNDFIDTEIAEVYTDWLNKKMFDWRKLIEKGLALEAPKGMYNT